MRQTLAQREAEARAARAEIERLRQERPRVNPLDAGGSALLAGLQSAIDEGVSRLESTEREIGVSRSGWPGRRPVPG